MTRTGEVWGSGVDYHIRQGQEERKDKEEERREKKIIMKQKEQEKKERVKGGTRQGWKRWREAV